MRLNRASLHAIPTELVKLLVEKHDCGVLRYVNKRLHGIAIASLHTHQLFILSEVYAVLGSTAYGDAVERLTLNLDHFTGNVRFEECRELSNLIKVLPALNYLEVNLERLNKGENVGKLIGSSTRVRELYPALETLRIYRPSFVKMPGFDKMAQDSFSCAVKGVVKESLNISLQTILIKNVEDTFHSEYKQVDANTYTVYLHVYTSANSADVFTELTDIHEKVEYLREYYPTCRQRIDSAAPNDETNNHDPLTDSEYRLLSPRLQKSRKQTQARGMS
ncbi:hypothetical protein E3P96_03366 [Wallemia ichthyophaga]|nr:hypothetical protein E3P96_03366 [Wallemia ichthyophaga]